MRGAGDAMSIGDRVRFYRTRRGLTQRQLAVMVGLAEETVSAIERGRRDPSRKGLVRFAQALRVSVPDLQGNPTLFEIEEPEGDDVPAVRDALLAPRRLSRVLFADGWDGEPPDPEREARYVEQVWLEYQAGRVAAVVAALPALLTTAQRLEADPGPRRLGWAVSARIHHLASTTLSKVGEPDLAWIAAERGMNAAEQADDPLVLASAARAGTHAFLATGRFDDAIDLGRTASEWLRSRMDADDPEALSLFGMLQLRTAIAAARRNDRATTTELMALATWAAERLGEDANHWQTGFGPTNVEVHRLAAALELGDVIYVADRAPSVDTSGMPAERTAAHLIDTGRAFSLLARDADALETLLEAERVAPQIVRHNPDVRETVKTLYRRNPVTGGRRSSALLRLAERVRAVS